MENGLFFLFSDWEIKVKHSFPRSYRLHMWCFYVALEHHPYSNALPSVLFINRIIWSADDRGKVKLGRGNRAAVQVVKCGSASVCRWAPGDSFLHGRQIEETTRGEYFGSGLSDNVITHFFFYIWGVNWNEVWIKIESKKTKREEDACFESILFLTRAGRKIFLICETSSWLKGHSHLMNRCGTIRFSSACI